MSSSFSYNFISNIANLKIFAHLKSAIMKVSYPKIWYLEVSWEESSIFSAPRNLKFKAILITEPQKSNSTVSEL